MLPGSSAGMAWIRPELASATARSSAESPAAAAASWSAGRPEPGGSYRPAAPPVAERQPAQLTVMEMAPEPVARGLLAPLAICGALRYPDAEGSELSLDLGAVAAEQRPGIEEVHRHRVTYRMVEVTQPTVAVFISPARPALEGLAVLRDAQVRTVVFRDSVLEADVAAELAGVEDPTERLLHRAPGERWARERPPGQDAVRPVPPYPYLMQRLVAEWTGRHG